MDNAEKYIKYALSQGAANAIKFDISDICFDPRTYLKCLYGCADFGRNHTCPSRPGTPSMAEYKEMFSRYKWGIIVHTHDKPLSQKISFGIESMTFGDGYYFAMSLSDCALCETCAAVDNKPCRFAKKARPAFHSVGIDVFKTVTNLGLPIYTLTDKNQEQNWYSAIFIE